MLKYLPLKEGVCSKMEKTMPRLQIGNPNLIRRIQRIDIIGSLKDPLFSEPLRNRVLLNSPCLCEYVSRSTNLDFVEIAIKDSPIASIPMSILTTSILCGLACEVNGTISAKGIATTALVSYYCYTALYSRSNYKYWLKMRKRVKSLGYPKQKIIL